MTGVLMQFGATETAASGDMLATLGIDWKLLVLQTIAFLLLLFVLTKFVFPKLGAMLEAREKLLDDSVKAAREAESLAQKASADTEKLMKKARKDADEMLSSAKAEATAMVDAAEKKSRERAERIVADAEADIEKNITEARRALRAETLELVAEATEKVVGRTVNASIDKRVVEHAIAEAKEAV